MKRIVIIGCPGVGKTTFSRKLAAKTNLPLTHLDSYYHDTKHDYQNDKQAWKQLVSSLVNKDKWIIEGNYKSTFELRFARADTIIYLDFPRRTAIYRTLKRRIQHHSKLRPEMPANWKEKISPKFMQFVWSFNATEKPMMYTLLAQQKDKNIVILKNGQETDAYLQMLQASAP